MTGKHRRSGPITSIYLIPEIGAKPGKHRKLNIRDKWRQLRVHMQNGQITLRQAFAYMRDVAG